MSSFYFFFSVWYNASGMVFFFFFRWYVFFCKSLTIFGMSKSFSVCSLSRNFLAVVDVIDLDINSLVLNSGLSHPFSSSISFFQWSAGVSVSDCFAEKNILVSCIRFFSAGNICRIVYSVFRFQFIPVRFNIRIVLLGVSFQIPMAKRNPVLPFLLLCSIWFRWLFFLWLVVQYLDYISFLYFVWIVLTIVCSCWFFSSIFFHLGMVFLIGRWSFYFGLLN